MKIKTLDDDTFLLVDKSRRYKIKAFWEERRLEAEKAFYNATQPRARSKNQSVGTPDNYLAAVRKEFTIVWDLAADKDNGVVPFYFDEAADALEQDWYQLPTMQNEENTWLWLNPPYKACRKWARKCAEESLKGARILFLVPASVGSEWYRSHVAPYAKVRFNTGRLTFKGHDTPYPRDTLLAVYRKGIVEECFANRQPCTVSWDWRDVSSE